MKKIILLLTVSLLCLLCACTASTASDQSKKEENKAATDTPNATYQKISAKEAKAMMDDGKPFILLDVRTDEEFAAERLDGAILIPDDAIGSRAEKELPDKNARILVYCRSGRRSALAAKELVGMGYTNVFDFGGIIDWPYGTLSE